MKSLIRILSILLVFFTLSSFNISDTKNYKCLMQMSNYSGEGAYVVVSIINPNGKYEKTIYIQGDDDKWYYEITSWWSYYGKNKYNVDGISGSTVSAGERSFNVFEIDESKIGKGYKLRFETAVEDENYFEKDIEFELTKDNLLKKHTGKGFIRYVRFISQ